MTNIPLKIYDVTQPADDTSEMAVLCDGEFVAGFNTTSTWTQQRLEAAGGEGNFTKRSNW